MAQDWTQKIENFSERRSEYEFSPMLNPQILNKMH